MSDAEPNPAVHPPRASIPAPLARAPLHAPEPPAAAALHPERGGRTRLLHQIFDAQAEYRPHAVAVEFGPERVTYAELERRAHRIARWLHARDVGRGSRVGLLLRRSPDAYAAMLGILHAGAAYVPIDPDGPPDRASFILADSGARALVTSEALAAAHGGFGGPLLRVDADRAALEAAGAVPLLPREVGVTPGDLCYVIYTSGSTGRPKGVMIEHRSAVHLVQTEGLLFQVRPGDRVYQGFTLAFDASVEEMWLAFRSGATLVAASPEMEQAGPDLSRLLAAAGVTVLSCVPTLLAMLEEDVPTLRLLILGGEACPEHLVARWARPGRRLVNTYGPTEATVIATCAELRPGAAVTIGSAIPGYRVHLLDPALRPVPRGAVGEIYIGGIGVARGYVNLPEQDRERFVPEPPWLYRPSGGRMYRTGDIGRMDGSGEILFEGRADGQVKLRGYRVELAEIESALMACDGVRSAACTVRDDMPGVPQLVGYVVPRNGAVDESRLRAALRERLPGYMVPSLIEPVRELPRLASGKLDRGALPAPGARVPTATGARRARTDTERAIAKVWECLLHPRPVGRDDDFFADLGGHSLLAARAVSELRKDPRFAGLSMVDLYRCRTLAELAAAVDARAAAGEGEFVERQPRSDPESTPGAWDASSNGHRATGSASGEPDASEGRRHRVTGVLQSAALYLVFGLGALEWVTPYLVFWLLLSTGVPALAAAGWAVLSAVAVTPLSIAIAVAGKWLVLGRVRPGRHRLWGAYHLRWWLAQSLVGAMPTDRLVGTPLLAMVYRLLGVRIGREVYVGTDHIAAFDLISIGDGSSVDDDASLLGCTVEDGELIVGPVKIGRDCFVGTRAVLRENTVLEDGARLEDLSLLPAGSRIPAGETWAGSPAHHAGSVARAAPPPAPGALRRSATVALYAALATLVPLVPLLAIVPGMAFLVGLDPIAHPWSYLAAAPLVGASFVLLMTAEVVALKWLLVGRVRAGTHPLHGGFYIRHWIVDQLMATSLEVIAPIYATLYVAPWYRALGARIGRRVELSTASSAPPDLLEVDDGGTIADEASVGETRIERGWMTLAPVRVGRRAFVGNSGVVPAGVSLGEDALVGVLSIAPAEPGLASAPGAAWLGSPPIALPRREASRGFREDRTYSPPRWLRLARGAFEILRVTLPPAGFVLVTAAVVSASLRLWSTLGPAATLLLVPLVYAACCAIALLAIAAAKWLVVGRYRPFVRPLWSPFVWRLELVNALYEFLATPLALGALQGTPLLPMYLRLLGARIGRRVHLDTTGFLEWDLVEIGDRAALNQDCVVQTHLFEDRMLKASGLRIGSGCTVGALSVVLYDSRMEDGASLDALSLLMKGETLARGTSWVGAPARPSGMTHGRWMLETAA